MVDIAAISGMMSAFKSAKDIAEAMVGLRDAATFQEKRLELQSKILDAQSGALALQEERAFLIERVSQLEKRIAEHETWKQKRIATSLRR